MKEKTARKRKRGEETPKATKKITDFIRVGTQVKTIPFKKVIFWEFEKILRKSYRSLGGGVGNNVKKKNYCRPPVKKQSFFKNWSLWPMIEIGRNPFHFCFESFNSNTAVWLIDWCCVADKSKEIQPFQRFISERRGHGRSQSSQFQCKSC